MALNPAVVCTKRKLARATQTPPPVGSDQLRMCRSVRYIPETACNRARKHWLYTACQPNLRLHIASTVIQRVVAAEIGFLDIAIDDKSYVVNKSTSRLAAIAEGH